MKKFYFVTIITGTVKFEDTEEGYNNHIARLSKSSNNYFFSNLYNTEEERDNAII